MSPVKKNTHIVLLMVFSDIAALVASFVLMYLFRFTTGFIPVKGHAPDFELYAKTLLVIIPVYLALFRSYGLYQSSRSRRRSEEIFLVMKAVTVAVFLLTAATFFYRARSYSRISLIILWFFSAFFISVGRYYLIQWEYRRKLKRKDMSRVLIIGANQHARNLIHWSQQNPHYGQEIIGVTSSDITLAGKHIGGVPILCGTEPVESMILSLKPDRVVLVENAMPRDRITELVSLCEDQFMDFKIAADFYGLLTRHVEVENVTSVPLLGFRSLPLDDLWNRFLKRFFDMIGASGLIVLTAPLSLLAMILIKMGDSGPLFYFQERTGRDEKVFRLIKFRTMRVDAESESGPVWTQANDSRRTRFGNFLRRFNIDELPQLWNVIRGDMSLVGPRPERPHFVNQFREDIPRYMARHKIKAGITGWAQVNGYRGNTSLHERIKYDLYYMENWSLLFDIEILFRTFFAYKNAY